VGSEITLVMAGLVISPFFLSFPFLLTILAMSYELSLEVVLAGQLSRDVKNFAAIVASSDDAILGKTLDGTVTTWNAGAAKMYGYSAREMIGQHVSVSNSLSGRYRELDQVPAMGNPPHLVQISMGHRPSSAGNGHRRVAVQRRVAARRVVIGLEIRQLPFQVQSIPEQHVVEKFSPHRPDQALHKGV
jgi:PAS domain-containing protein